MIFQRLIISLFILFFLVACSKWPPFDDDLKQYYEDHKKSIIGLMDVMLETDYIEVYDAGLSGSVRVRRSFDEQRQLMDSKDGEIFRNLLEEAGVYGVQREDGILRFELLPEVSAGTQYLLSFIYSHNREGLVICQPKFKVKPQGLCVISLDDNWWIEYKWYDQDV